MKFQRRVDRFNLVVRCTKDLDKQAEALLDVLAQRSAHGVKLRDGLKVTFGWSQLTLRGDETELLVHEPNFAGDPFKEQRPDVDQTLRVWREQTALAKRVGAVAMAPSFGDKVLVAEGCLDKKNLYLERIVTEVAHDSGWYIGTTKPAKRGKTVKLAAVYVYKLMEPRPSLMQALALPPGYVVTFVGDSIASIVNAEGRNVGLDVPPPRKSSPGASGPARSPSSPKLR